MIMQDVFQKLPAFERALALAAVYHAEQKDKAGIPYIHHVLRVMMGVDKEEEKIVALLHDLIEDTPLTGEDLERLGFQEEIIESVKLLTRVGEEDYMAYVRRLAQDPWARQVKLSDLRDNQRRGRVEGQGSLEEEARLKKYQQAERFLKEIALIDEIQREKKEQP